MAPSTLFLASMLVGLAASVALPDGCPQPKPDQCPKGATTTTVIDAYEPTRTFYPSTFYDGVFVDCHGYTTISAFVEVPTAQAYVTAKSGEVTSASYMCSPSQRPGCPTAK